MEQNRQYFSSIIIGAGASGLMCAENMAQYGNVLVLEKNPQIASKVKISGGGRCNFTNIGVTSDNYLCSNRHFVKSALARFKPLDIIKDLEQYHIKYE